MTETVWETNSAAETEAIGRALAASAMPGDVYALDGDLGTGKTVFARGFARGLGIERTIASPTFTIVREYREGRLPLFHLDVYRLENEDELYDIGWDEYLAGGGVCLVEWASLVPEAMPEETNYVTIEKDPAKGEDYRLVRLKKKESTCWY